MIQFILVLSIVILETAILVINIDDIKVSSFDEFPHNPNKLGIYLGYTLSVILLPFVSVASLNVIKSVRNIYRSLAVKSLRFNSIEIAIKYVNILITMLPLTLLLMVSGIIFRLYVFTLFSLVPLIFLGYVIAKPFVDVYDHSKNIENELKWFLILMIVTESVRANIGFLIDKLKRTRILSAITKELTVINRDSLLYLPSYIDSFIHRAKYTPNSRLSNMFTGYASRLRSGGDTVSWLRSKLGEELTISEFSAKLYSERISNIFGQIMLALYALLPLVAISTYALNITTVMLLNTAVTPLLVLTMYTIRPKSLDIFPMKHLFITLTVMVLSSLLLYVFMGSISLAIGWILALILSHRYRSILKEISILEKDCIEIMKLMVELRRNGYDVAKAIEYIISTNTLNETTKRKLRLALTMLRQGVSLTETSMKIPTHSFLFKFTLFTLGLVHECGGGDPEVFQAVYEYINKISILQNAVKKISTLFDVFALVNTVLIVWIWRTLIPLHTSLSYMGIGSAFGIDINMLYLLIYSSLLGYTMVSSTLRTGLPVIEFRSIAFLAIGTLLPLLL
ncbi:MAG: hypothetical protein QW101_07365 [Ignisphaera sp.]|uniref:Type II secretion system protein GspF domain-containing protein n=1 Tax=Ignisphaera aggregans TaxID=334771 RepID=A0A7J3N0Q5_9CREN